MLNYINGDLVGRTNLTNFRASERRAELVRAMPSAAENLKANFRAAENIELVKIRATDQVAILFIDKDS
ncbi:MAG: hypothetical protein ACI3ZA_01525 [Alloprevotella sp.]